LIRFVNKRITILGEVRIPGTYIYTKDHLNILEAVALAGDITIHGNRKEVDIIRSQAGVTTNTRVNMTKDDLFLTDNYYLRSDDIIYVKSRNSVKWGVISVPINLAFGTVTTALLIYSFFQ
jgi:polysaccharide export outer membrane protein